MTARLIGDWKSVLRSVAVFTVALLSLLPNGLNAVSDADTARDLGRARDCLESAARCDGLQTDAHLAGLMHGPAWLRFLIATRAMGFGPVAQAVILVVLIALAAAVIDRWALFAFPAGFALPAAAIFVVIVGGMPDPLLTNPFLGVLPGALFYAALAGVVAGGSRGWIVASGLALYVCIDAHVSCLLFFPVFVATSVITARRPFADAALAVGSVAVPAILFSASTYLTNLGFIDGIGTPLLLITLAGALVAWRARPWWARQTPLLRQSVAMLSCTSWFAAVEAAAVMRNGWPFVPRYALPIAPGLAVIGAAALWLIVTPLRRRWPLVAEGFALGVVGYVAAPIMIRPAASRAPQTLREVEILSSYLHAQGWSYDHLRRAMQGPRIHGQAGFLNALSIYSQPATDAWPPATQLRVVVADPQRSSAPPGWETIDLRSGRVAIVSTITGWVQSSRMRVLVDGRSLESAEDPYRSPRFRLDYASAQPLLVGRELGLTEELSGTTTVTVEMPIAVVGSDPERVLDSMAEARSSDWTPWTILSVTGVAADIAPGGDSVTLRAAGSTPGLIRFVTTGPRRSWTEHPLGFMETRPQESAIRAVVRLR